MSHLPPVQEETPRCSERRLERRRFGPRRGAFGGALLHRRYLPRLGLVKEGSEEVVMVRRAMRAELAAQKEVLLRCRSSLQAQSRRHQEKVHGHRAQIERMQAWRILGWLECSVRMYPEPNGQRTTSFFRLWQRVKEPAARPQPDLIATSERVRVVRYLSHHFNTSLAVVSN